ncbi:hypothetical protein CUMW_206760 [Citrus unshiu]|nr:hypothetical protein CUMW_206760 [Citrus unshiu]
MKKPNNATVGSSKTKFEEESEEEDNKTTSVTSSEEERTVQEEESWARALTKTVIVVYGHVKAATWRFRQKKPVSRFRAGCSSTAKRRDARFESLCGNLDVVKFHDSPSGQAIKGLSQPKSTDAAILAEHQRRRREATKATGKRPFYL